LKFSICNASIRYFGDFERFSAISEVTAEKLDVIAERIRALGFPAPYGGQAIAALSSIPEAEGVPEAMAMVRELVAGHEAVARTARSVFALTEAANDQPTADLLTQRLQIHEKTAWMLRSLLEG
jgi:starvation-inducible DNA-binding protein